MTAETVDVLARVKAAKLLSYDHGGGRLYFELPGGGRDLIADFYGDGHYRDFFMEVIGAVEQLRRIDKAARAFVDNFPSSYVDDGNCRKEWRELNEALFNGDAT